MLRCLFPILLSLLCGTAAAEVVYVKRSDLFAFAMGQQVGTAAAQIGDIRQYTAHRQGGYARLDALRKEAAACGSCAQRERLAAEIRELQANLLREDRIMCGTWNALSFSDPSLGGVMKLSGYGSVCEAFNREATLVEAARRDQRNKEEFAARVKAGDLGAYSAMGYRTMTAYGHLPAEQQRDLACPYWFAGSAKGDAASTTAVASLCLLNSPVEADRREAFDRLKACAARPSHLCASTLAEYYETTRRADLPWPAAADDRQALGLHEQVVRHWEQEASRRPGDRSVTHALDTARKAADAVRARLSGQSSQPPSGPAVGVEVRADEPSGEATEPARRADSKARRCEALKRAVERARDADRAAGAQAMHDKLCRS